MNLTDNPIWKRIKGVADQLSDEDLNEVIIFAAYLQYRRRVFKVAHEQNARLAERIAKGEMDYAIEPVPNGEPK